MTASAASPNKHSVFFPFIFEIKCESINFEAFITMKWFTSTSFEILTAGKHTATLFEEETFASVTNVRLSDVTDDVAVDAG